MIEKTNNKSKGVFEFTEEQLSKFYLRAFRDGADARNISGMCADIELRHVSIERITPALIKAFTETKD